MTRWLRSKSADVPGIDDRPRYFLQGHADIVTLGPRKGRPVTDFTAPVVDPLIDGILQGGNAALVHVTVAIGPRSILSDAVGSLERRATLPQKFRSHRIARLRITRSRISTLVRKGGDE